MGGGDVGGVVVEGRGIVGAEEGRYLALMVEGLGLRFVLRRGREKKFSVLATAGR